MRKKGIVAAGGAAALVVMTAAGPALADSQGSVKEKVVGPGDLIHVTATGCNIGTPWLNGPFTGDPKAQKWTKKGKVWSGVVQVTKWGIFKPHPKTHTSVSLMCAGSGPRQIPINWDPNHGPGDKPKPTPTTKPTTKPTDPGMPRTFKVTVSPKRFHAGDTLTVRVYRCAAKPSVESKILTGGAHWSKKDGVWKTPVQVRKGLRVGYYKFTVSCKGFSPVVFKVRYGYPKDNGTGSNPTKPAKHTPTHQTKYLPNGGPSTGGGSTAKSFV